MQRYIPLVLILGLLIGFRLLGSAFPEYLPNFQPLTAIFFCGCLLATGWKGYALPLAVWLVTYPFATGPVGDWGIFLTAGICLSLMYVLGLGFRRFSTMWVWLGSALAAVLFHTLTCTLAWAIDPMYAKTGLGLWQSLWLGPDVAGALPSWIFLRNMCAANLLFTGIILMANCRMPRLGSAPSVSKQPVLS